MSFYSTAATTNSKGSPYRIIVHKERYFQNIEASKNDLRIGSLSMDNAYSPPLAKNEIADIQASIEEFSQGKCALFENVDNFITALHNSRERHKRERNRR
jgi:hypothetical protein